MRETGNPFFGFGKQKTYDPERMGEVLSKEEASCGQILVTEQFFRGHHARLLFVDGALQSAVPLEEGERWTLLFPYMRGFDWALRMRNPIRSALLIGGGGFVYADHFLHECPGASLDVVEMNARIIEIARKYFFLNEVEREYDAFSLYQKEGLSFLLGCGQQYEVIFNDAFQGFLPDSGLFSEDGMAVVRAHLKEGGLYLCNLVSAVKGPGGLFGHKLKKRALRHFRNVALFQADDRRSPYEKQNCLLVASDRSM